MCLSTRVYTTSGETFQLLLLLRPAPPASELHVSPSLWRVPGVLQSHVRAEELSRRTGICLPVVRSRDDLCLAVRCPHPLRKGETKTSNDSYNDYRDEYDNIIGTNDDFKHTIAIGDKGRLHNKFYVTHVITWTISYIDYNIAFIIK